MSAPPVSIVIPAYNSEALLGQTVESVLGQTFQDWEMVILDDGSRDSTFAVAQSFAAQDGRIRALTQPNGGIAVARANGYAATNPESEFVIFLDNDDLWEPDALATLVSALEANPGCPAAHALARSIDVQGCQPDWDDLEKQLSSRRAIVGGREFAWPPDCPTTFAALAVHNYIVSPGVCLVRRDAFQRSGGFVAETVPCDDWDLWVRLARTGDIAYIPRVLLNWRRTGANASDRSPVWRQKYYLVRDRMVASRENTPEQRRIALAAYTSLCRRMLGESVGSTLCGRPRAGIRSLRKALYGCARRMRAARALRHGNGG